MQAARGPMSLQDVLYDKESKEFRELMSELDAALAVRVKEAIY